MLQGNSGDIWERGFTLVEMLIALAILAMIVVSTFTIFRSSSRSWQKGEARSKRYHNARMAIGKMSTEISQAVISENTLSEFIGEKDEVSFISFVSSASGIFELTEVEYWLDAGEKFLMRNEDTEPDYDFTTQDYSDILAEGISQLEFSYYDGKEWTESWGTETAAEDEEDEEGEGFKQEKENILPKAVKIRIKVEGKKGKESEIFEVVTRLKTA